jgi:multisubunit Na+/H+ antiporter MnhC subunit
MDDMIKIILGIILCQTSIILALCVVICYLLSRGNQARLDVYHHHAQQQRPLPQVAGDKADVRNLRLFPMLYK